MDHGPSMAHSLQSIILAHTNNSGPTKYKGTKRYSITEPKPHATYNHPR